MLSAVRLSKGSMYRFSRRGCVRRKRSSVTERKMLAIVGEGEGGCTFGPLEYQCGEFKIVLMFV